MIWRIYCEREDWVYQVGVLLAEKNISKCVSKHPEGKKSELIERLHNIEEDEEKPSTKKQKTGKDEDSERDEDDVESDTGKSTYL